jgi:cytochrome c553
MMRWSGAKRSLVSGVCAAFVAAGGFGVASAQEALTEEAYGPTMSEIRLIVGDAELHVDARYWPELGEDLDKLFPMFRQIEAFWGERGNDDAVAKTLTTVEALREIGQAGIAMDQGSARSGIRALRATCASCHEAHREETADGYRIKPGS